MLLLLFILLLATLPAFGQVEGNPVFAGTGTDRLTVNTTGQSNGQVLTYDGVTDNRWEPTTSGTVGTIACNKNTIGEADLTNASTTEDETLFSATQKQKIAAVIVKHSTAFTGGGLTAMTVSVGISTDVTAYSAAFDIFQTAGDTVFQDTNVFKSTTMASGGHTLIARFTSTGANVSAATAGSVDIWVCSVPDLDAAVGGADNFGVIGNATADIGNDTLTITDGLGVAFTTTNDPEDLTATWAYTATLAGNPALGAEECVATTDDSGGGGNGGFLCEGTLADANEQLYLFPSQNGADTIQEITLNDATQTLTNKTIDCEATGNSCGTVFEVQFPAAGCDNATSGTAWDLPASNAPTTACLGTSPHRFGVLDFSDGANEIVAVNHFKLPEDWNSGANTDVHIDWTANSATTNAVRWTVETACIADDEALIAPTYNNDAGVANFAHIGTAHDLNNDVLSNVTMTGCAAGEHFFLKITRDANNAGDTLTEDARLLHVSVLGRRTQ